jgi:8-oxo-dGTP pyrophosphatase MutT (NUDIX family)
MRFTYCPHCGQKAILKEVGDEGMIPFCESCSVPLWDVVTPCIICAVVNDNREVALIKQSYLTNTNYVCVAGVMKIGESAEETAIREIKEEIAKDKYKESELKPADGMKLFYDDFSGRIFESTIEKVQEAEYNINRDLSMEGYATLNQFYDYLGLVPIDGGDELGWSSGMNFDYYWQEWIDFGHHKTTMGDDLECIMITMFSEPTLSWKEY